MTDATITLNVTSACSAMMQEDALDIKRWEKDVHHMKHVGELECAYLKQLYQLMAHADN